jgi:L,D-transpeptidase catalytic domain
MRIGSLMAPLAAATVMVMIGQAAHADLLIQIDKSAQRMTVTVDGEQRYDWPVSTGGAGYGTPSGTFKPFRMDIDHYSVEWDNAPMPYSVFFTMTGDAIHGTYEVRHLGSPVSHGFTRLRASVGEECRRALEAGEEAEDGQHYGGVKRGGSRCWPADRGAIPRESTDHR